MSKYINLFFILFVYNLYYYNKFSKKKLFFYNILIIFFSFYIHYLLGPIYFYYSIGTILYYSLKKYFILNIYNNSSHIFSSSSTSLFPFSSFISTSSPLYSLSSTYFQSLLKFDTNLDTSTTNNKFSSAFTSSVLFSSNLTTLSCSSSSNYISKINYTKLISNHINHQNISLTFDSLNSSNEYFKKNKENENEIDYDTDYKKNNNYEDSSTLQSSNSMKHSKSSSSNSLFNINYTPLTYEVPSIFLNYQRLDHEWACGNGVFVENLVGMYSSLYLKRKLLTKISNCCRQHDIGYEECDGREKSDIIFYNCLRNTCLDNYDDNDEEIKDEYYENELINYKSNTLNNINEISVKEDYTQENDISKLLYDENHELIIWNSYMKKENMLSSFTTKEMCVDFISDTFYFFIKSFGFIAYYNYCGWNNLSSDIKHVVYNSFPLISSST